MKKIFLCILFIAIIATGCSSNSDKLTLKGDIQNNIISANSTQPGKIVKMNKQQGEPVKKGDIIAVIDNTNQKYAVDQLQAVLTMKKAKLDELQAGARPQQIDQEQAQVDASFAQLDLITSTSGSKTQAITVARSNYDAAKAQLSLLKSGATKQTISIAKADIVESVAQLNQAQNTLTNCNIVALADGIIISKNFGLGDIVNIGSNIADIAISNDLYVLCYIPDKYLDKISYNQQLTVTDSTGTQMGKVNYIALQHEYTPKDEQSTSDSSQITTKIKVAIKDAKGILKSGMTANVEVPLK